MRRRIGLVAVLAIAAIAGAAFLLPHRSDFEAALSAAPVSAAPAAPGIAQACASNADQWRNRLPLQRKTTVPGSREAIKLSFAPIVKHVAPAVVNVYATSRVQVRSPFEGDPFFERFFGGDLFGGPRERQRSSLGSGVIVDPSGVIVTNNHVVGDATDVKVALSDGRELPATILLKDERTDLAILKIGNGKEDFPVLRDRQFRRARSRRPRARRRRSLRRRADGDERHRLRRRPHQSRHQRFRLLHPDRRRHQSGQFRRRAGRHGRQARRHQHRDLLAHRRLDRDRVRHPLRHGADGVEPGGRRLEVGGAAVDRRRLPGRDAGDRRLARA